MADASGRRRIVIAGAGVAGSLLAAGLARRADIDLLCLERAPGGARDDAGTGLNLGPNAIKCLRLFLPDHARLIEANSLPWRRWTTFTVDGRVLMDLDLQTVADTPGVRIGWGDLYALLRAQIPGPVVRYGVEVVDLQPGHPTHALRIRDLHGREDTLGGIDLLIAADGRYSRLRALCLDDTTPAVRQLGVGLFRLLVPSMPDDPVDDYAQWFNGANRLLAYRIPGERIYCAGSFPIPPDQQVPEALKQQAHLAQAYLPQQGRPSRAVRRLVDAIVQRVPEIHWARLQDAPICLASSAGMMLVGDAAHPMVPTLGQGATQAVEDACVALDEIQAALDSGRPLAEVAPRTRARRDERVRFVAAFSREASDTMLAGSDPVAGTLKKLEPAFMSKLARLYRDTPVFAS